MASEAAKGGNFFRKHYRRGMIGLVAVTAIAAGGKLLWEQVSPKPEPTLSAQLTQQYLARFSHLGVTAMKREYHDSYVKVERGGKETLYVSELNCTVPDLPSGDPWPPTFDVEREGRQLNVYGPIDRKNFTLPEYHDAVARCLDAGLVDAAHADQAAVTWGRR